MDLWWRYHFLSKNFWLTETSQSSNTLDNRVFTVFGKSLRNAIVLHPPNHILTSKTKCSTLLFIHTALILTLHMLNEGSNWEITQDLHDWGVVGPDEFVLIDHSTCNLVFTHGIKGILQLSHSISKDHQLKVFLEIRKLITHGPAKKWRIFANIMIFFLFYNGGAMFSPIADKKSIFLGLYWRLGNLFTSEQKVIIF